MLFAEHSLFPQNLALQRRQKRLIAEQNPVFVYLESAVDCRMSKDSSQQDDTTGGGSESIMTLAYDSKEEIIQEATQRHKCQTFFVSSNFGLAVLLEGARKVWLTQNPAFVFLCLESTIDCLMSDDNSADLQLTYTHSQGTDLEFGALAAFLTEAKRTC